MNKLWQWLKWRITNCAWGDRVKTIVSIASGLLVGAVMSWWINRPEHPWLTITAVSATYIPGSTEIKVRGTYEAIATCPRERAIGPDPLVWRQEVEGSGPEIASYAPRPAPPRLELGVHQFEIELPLNAGINPDGWRVSLLVTCAHRALAVRSDPVPVVFIGGQDFGPRQ